MILLYIHVVCLIQRENWFYFVGFKAADTDNISLHFWSCVL